MDGTQRHKVVVIALGMLLVCCPCASALDPSLDINQYVHTAWTLRDGLFKGFIYAITQTADGYLWLGTEFGLYRFDGVRSVPWHAPAGEYLPDNTVLSLLAARDGRLWIGTSQGLASWKDAKLTHYPELAGQRVPFLLEDLEGTVWVGTWEIPTGKLCAIRNTSAKCFGEDGRFGDHVGSFHEDSEGNLWATAQTGLWRLKPDPPKLFAMPGANSLTQGDGGALLISVSDGIRKLVDGTVEAFPLPGAGRLFKSGSRLFRDRDGGLWIGTYRGLMHVHQGKTDLFAQSDGLSSDLPIAFFEDREGNMWVATANGLDRFRNVAVPTISVKQGLSNATVESVLAASDGSVWLGTRDGLNRLSNGHVTTYRKQSGLPDDVIDSLFQDDRGRVWVSTDGGLAYFVNGRFTAVEGISGKSVTSIAGDAGENLWISDQYQGLLHLLKGRVVEATPWARLARDDYAWALAPDPVKHGLWLGFLRSGLAYFKDGQIRTSYAVSDGLGEGRVNGLRTDPDGTLWAATEGGLSRVKDGRVATLTHNNGLPCDSVGQVVEDDAHAFWLDTACGLVRIARPELDAWVTDRKRMVQTTVFDAADGVSSHSITTGYSPGVAKSQDGRLWLLPREGVSVVDPLHLPVNTLAPPVHIEQISADRQTYETSSQVRLPPLIRDLQIDYTALSFVAPEKNRFKVKLEGWDRDWQDVGNRRQAFYNYLPPRTYRFRVIASNNSGVWNEAGTFLDFSIAPAYYQTNWFRLSCVIAFTAMLWGLYRLRLHQLARQLDMRLEERVSERTRIARELHDTLLQNLHGLLFRFQAARNMLPRRTEEAMEALDGAISRTEQAIAESRDTIKDLRYERASSTDLAELITQTGRELESSADANGNPPTFRVIVEGERQTLSPVLQDEVYRIARELLRNAFQHAGARHIEADIRYDHHFLRVLIRDDGKGMDSKVLKEGGQPGHWGLPGVRERAKQIGARLDFWSDGGAGTEVQLTVPVSVDSEKPRHGSQFRLLHK